MPAISEVERQAYKIPEQSHLLQDSSSLRGSLVKPDVSRIEGLFQVAEESSFKHYAYHRTKQGVWKIFTRQDFHIPNFPEGETIIPISALAIYEKREIAKDGKAYSNPQNALLRMSSEPILRQEFVRDLDLFTKYYVERPRFLGFPSKLTSSPKSIIAGSLLEGTVGAGASILLVSTGHLQSVDAGAVYALSVMVGMIAGIGTSGIVHDLSERHAENKASGVKLDQYVRPERVKSVLENQREHIARVAIQKELYGALLAAGMDLTPDRFLSEIYAGMPKDTIKQRMGEIAEGKVPNRTLSQMVEKAAIIKEISHLRQLLKVPTESAQTSLGEPL